jgi:hypothetical protein
MPALLADVLATGSGQAFVRAYREADRAEDERAEGLPTGSGDDAGQAVEANRIHAVGLSSADRGNVQARAMQMGARDTRSFQTMIASDLFPELTPGSGRVYQVTDCESVRLEPTTDPGARRRAR